MLFVFENEAPRSFYMKNTKFSLDIIYVDKNKRIVSIVKKACLSFPPFVVSVASLRVRLVLNATHSSPERSVRRFGTFPTLRGLPQLHRAVSLCCSG